MSNINEGLNSVTLKQMLPTAFCAVISMTMGVMTLIGWYFDIAILRSIVPGYATMKVNTAMCFIISGGALLLLGSYSRSPERLRFGLLLAFVVTLIGMMTLGEEVFDWQLGIDELLFKYQDRNEVFTSSPGRMSIPTTIAFILTGLSLLTINWEPRIRFVPSELLAISVFLMSTIAAIEFIFGRGITHPFIDNTRMAVHTLTTFYMLSIGLLLARPRRGMLGVIRHHIRSSLEFLVYFSLLLGFITLLATGGAAYFAAQDSVTRSRLVDHTYEVREKLIHQLSAHYELQIGNRGYVITGQPESLEHFEKARSTSDSIFQDLTTLVQDNPIQTSRLDLLDRLRRQHIAWTARVVELEFDGDTEMVQELMDSGYGDQLMNSLRDIIDEMDADEARLLSKRAEEERTSIAKLNWTIFASTLFSLFVVCFASFIIQRDFSQRHRDEQTILKQNKELEFSNERTRSIVESVVDAIITIDSRGIIQTFNSAATHIFGFSEQETIGQNVKMLMPEPDRSQHDQYLANYMETGRPKIIGKGVEVTGRRKDGSLFPMELYVSEMQLKDHLQFTGVIRDITDRKKIDSTLRQATEAAESANKAKSQFLANMSHELRTPLNAIIGYSEMLAEDAEAANDEQTVSDLKKIQGAGRHLLYLINDILDLSKIEAGKAELSPEWVYVPDLLNDIATMVVPLIEKNTNVLKVECDVGIGEIYTDPTKLRQILFNLISNSAKFTTNGQVTLSVKLPREDSTKDVIVFEVEDTGIGMDEEQLKRLFKPFMQADASISRKYGGTGLGLALSWNITNMLEGELKVQSTPDEGTLFILTLPVSLNWTKSNSTEQKTTEPESLVSQSEKNTLANILIIDDDAEARDLLRKYLEKNGWKVTDADNAVIGLKLARELKPAAITLDVMMPGLDGWATLELLKADPETSGIPVIMCTIVDESRRGFALGVSDYLVKPISKNRLINTLNKFSRNKPCHLLIVEDDDAMREMLARTARKTDCKVTEATNGKEGLECIEEQKPDLILLDLMMPIVDGFSVIEALREKPEWKDIPIVVVTSKDLSKQDLQRLNGYVESVVNKYEYDTEELLEEIRKLLDKLV